MSAPADGGYLARARAAERAARQTYDAHGLPKAPHMHGFEPCERDREIARRLKAPHLHRGPMPGAVPKDLAEARRAGPPPKVEASGGDGSHKVLALGSDGQFFVRQVPKGYVTRSGEEREV